LINGLRGYAETEEGKRYTLEWSLNSLTSSSLTYGDNRTNDRDWYKSPVNCHPLSVLPNKTREGVLQEINNGTDYITEVETGIDPFSREAFDKLSEEYSSFEDIVSSEHLKVKRFLPEVGDGIGVLHAEDEGNPKQKLVGSWMQGAMENFVSRGQKNAQAFSYEGVLCQGNGTISIIEDASHHSETLDRMMNLVEEGMVKLDNKIAMDIDTLPIIISNPDLYYQLSEHDGELSADPFRALRRRLDKYDLNYLVTLSLETLLLKRHITGTDEIWQGEDRKREPVEIDNVELAPHTLESAAVYEIATRLFTNGKFEIGKLIELFNEGKVEINGEVRDVESFKEDNDLNFHESMAKGEDGIPVTFTTDVIIDLIQQEESPIMPEDVIDSMKDNLTDSEVFGATEVDNYEDISFDVRRYVLDEQIDDVLEGMVGDISVTEEDVREYIDGISAWQDDEGDDFDEYELREFETRYLGKHPDEYTEDAEGSKHIENFRQKILRAFSDYVWEHKDEGYEFEDVPISETPELAPLIEENDWKTVDRVYPDADLNQWRNPPSDTQTEELKEKTINNMVEKMDYSKESAEKTTTRVIDAIDSLSAMIKNGT
jgi:predicted Ser/Thr protein kinase